MATKPPKRDWVELAIVENERRIRFSINELFKDEAAAKKALCVAIREHIAEKEKELATIESAAD